MECCFRTNEHSADVLKAVLTDADPVQDTMPCKVLIQIPSQTVAML